MSGAQPTVVRYPKHEEGYPLLARLTSENELTLPEGVVAAFEGVEYFDVAEESGRIVLTPMRLSRANVVRDKLADLGLTEADVAEAVAWARQS